MKTEHLFAKVLKETMAEIPLEDISVSLLSQKVGMHIKSFYYHFHDIYDLLTQVFLDEKIPNIEQVTNQKELVKTVYHYYIENQSFIDATLASAGKDLFFEFLYNNCYVTFLRFVDQEDINHKLLPNDKKSIARFFSGAYAYYIVYYFLNFKNKSESGLCSMFDFLNENNIQDAVNKYLKKKEGK